MRGKHLSVVVATSMTLLAACSSVDDGSNGGADGQENPVDEQEAVVTEPTSALVAGSDASTVSIAASEQLFDSSRGAVVTDEGSQLEAASLAATYSVPILVNGEAIADELDRLGSEWVITVETDLDGVDGLDILQAVSAAGDDEESDSADETESEPAPELEPDPSITIVEPEGEGLDALLAVDEGEAFMAPEQNDIELDHGIESLEGTVVLTDGSWLAAAGTARAAGAELVPSPADPRGSSAAIEAAESADAVMGLFDGELTDFEWQLATASTGVELPGGTQHVFGDKRYIALYGSPITPSLGLLGEQDVPATVARAEEMAEPYRTLTDDTVVPAQEIIVTVAAGTPGDDGNYSHEGAIDWFVPLIEAAGEAGQYVVLDFQPGRSDFLSQIQQYEELLAYPHVGIALDPEWRIGPEEQPLARIGHVEIDEVNEVITYLSDYVREHELPQKMIILHQFQLQMIRDRDQVDQSRSEVALLIHADGQGGQGAKADTWRTLHQDAPEDIAWGWKNFIDEDLPMLTPEETYEVDPLPEFVSYQ